MGGRRELRKTVRRFNSLWRREVKDGKVLFSAWRSESVARCLHCSRAGQSNAPDSAGSAADVFRRASSVFVRQEQWQMQLAPPRKPVIFRWIS